MNCKIGFMSFMVIISIVFLFLLVSGKVEAEPQKCIGSCTSSSACGNSCIKMGYKIGECAGWKNPDKCCCMFRMY
ncbi:PREDICTED: putative defensin-like protein 73 [Camelina sativa]|uniref:Defensin-like protein 73 n=1 Tax=Camelina sativa TaxID=90675 RepID=A0ABM1R0A4_CAMSA|nr:PREDICTED: putative defensin-like protein 73 [Camelina sativa]